MGGARFLERKVLKKILHFLIKYVFSAMPVKRAPKIVKPVPNARESRAQSTKKGAPVKLPDLREEEEEKVEEPVKEKSWLDTLPPIEKPDEELHIQLTMQRRAATREKHLAWCRRELYAIFNCAMRRRCVDETDEREVEHVRLRFLNGDFHDPEPVPEEEEEEQEQQSKRLSKKPGIKHLLDFGLTSVGESMLALSRETSRERFEHDSNLEMDRMLGEIEKGRAPYIREKVPDTRVSCPFLICVAGPPGTGRSTVSQFIERFFDVKVIHFGENKEDKEKTTDSVRGLKSARGEKSPVPKLIEELAQVPAGTGVVVEGFPETKVQFGQFEKGLAAAAKKKGDFQFNAVSGVIRLVMTEQEAREQAEGKRVDPTTGKVYHETFYPPIYLNALLKQNLVEMPLPDDYSTIFQKVTKDMTALDGALKKTKVLSMPRFESAGECFLAVENFLRLLYAAKNIDVPFTSFVVFQTRPHFLYAKACAKLYKVWNDKCLPMFGKDLGDLYKRIEQAELRANYLQQNSVKTFQLIISRPDDRITRCRKFMEHPTNEECADLFHYVWQKSIDIRDETLKKVVEYCPKCSLTSLKGVMKEGEQAVFELILKRYFIVDWFTRHFAKILEQGTLEKELEVPEIVIPKFDVTNLKELCELMGIHGYTPAAAARSREVMSQQRLEVEKEALIRNRTQEYLPTSKEGLEGSGPIDLASTKQPVKAPFPSHITFEIRSEYAIDCGEPDGDAENEPAPPPPESNEETIRNFLDYVISRADPVTKQEAIVMRNMFDFFLEKKKSIDNKVNHHLKELENELDALIRRKCSNEMEWFSQKIRKWKRGERFDGELFVYDTSFLDEECLDLYRRLQGEIPQEKEVPNIDPEKVKQLYIELRKLGLRFVSLNQILSKAADCGFTDKEQALVHVIAQVEALPEFIDLTPFCERLSPSLEEFIQEERREAKSESKDDQGKVKMSQTLPMVVQSKIVDIDPRAASACGTERKLDVEEPVAMSAIEE